MIRFSGKAKKHLGELKIKLRILRGIVGKSIEDFIGSADKARKGNKTNFVKAKHGLTIIKAN